MSLSIHNQLIERIASHVSGVIERIDTHAATILLFGNEALKLKKPVRFSFLDFTNPQARRSALADELRWNRRTAPDIYRKLVGITTDGTIARQNHPRAVEWALLMARFDQKHRLDRVAERGDLSGDLIEALAKKIVLFHHSLEPVRDVRESTSLEEVVAGNQEDLQLSTPRVFEHEAIKHLTKMTSETLERDNFLLTKRFTDGKVRHCHGDLHLANIVLIEGQPVLFDCIEFDRSFAVIDVLYDLAFLIMDLIDRGFQDEACYLVQVYLDWTGDDEGMALLPLFISIRATVRAKIEAVSEHSESARNYLQLAIKSLEPPAPKIVAIGGRSGTGKSTLASALAPKLGAIPGAVLLRSDVIRKRMFDKDPKERLPVEAYREEISSQVFATINSRASDLLAAGRTVIADGVFGHLDQRRTIEAVALKAGVPFVGLWLEAPTATLEKRVAGRVGDASDADVDVVHQQSQITSANVDWIKIDAGSTSANLVNNALRAIDPS